jgi:hypothetical protein
MQGAIASQPDAVGIFTGTPMCSSLSEGVFGLGAKFLVRVISDID